MRINVGRLLHKCSGSRVATLASHLIGAVVNNMGNYICSHPFGHHEDMERDHF